MAYDKSTIKTKIRSYLLQTTFAENEKIHDGSLIFKEGYLDSMGFIMMITFIEEEFGIKTDDEDLIEENFQSINSITDFICRKLQNSVCAE